MVMALYINGPRTAVQQLPAADVTAGDVIVQGNLTLISDVDNPPGSGLSRRQSALYIGGVYQVAVDGPIPIGSYVFWNSSTSKVTLTEVAGQTTPFGWVIGGANHLLSDTAPANSGDLCAVLHDPETFGESGSGLPITNTAITTVGAGVLTAAALAGGIITRSGSVAAYTDTTDTAALIVAALPNPVIGQAWIVEIKNAVAFPETVAGGVGVTVSGISIVPPLSVGRFLLTYTAANTLTMVGLGSYPLCNVPPSKFSTAATSNGTAAAGELSGAAFTAMKLTANGANAYTTRTAAQMFADIPNCQAGFSYVARLISGGDNTVTLTAGANVTITGTATVATGKFRDFVVTFTDSTHVTFQDIGGN